MSNSNNQNEYRKRQLAKGRKNRTTQPISVSEWEEVKRFIKSILNLRGSK